MQKVSKAKKKSTEVFAGLKRSQPSTSGAGKPFRQAPLPNRNQRENGRGWFFSRFGQKSKSVIFSQSKVCESVFTLGIKKCLPIGKGFVIKEIPLSVPVSGRLRFFLKNWQYLTQNLLILSFVQVIRFPFSRLQYNSFTLQ